MSEKTRSWGFGALTIAIIAAVVGGLFTLAPIAYDYLKNIKSLTYNVIGSNVLDSGSQKQIYIVDIENSGSTTLKEVLVLFEIPNATFRDISTHFPVGINPVFQEGDGKISWNIDVLNSGESARIAFLVEAPSLEIGDFVSLRANDLPAKQIRKAGTQSIISELVKENPTRAFFISSFLLGVYLLMGTVALRRFRSPLGFIGTKDDYTNDRLNCLSYISSLLLSEPLSERVAQAASWAGAADAIYLAHRKGEVQLSSAVRALLGLDRCRFRMAPSSRKTVDRHLRALIGEDRLGILRQEISESADIRSDFEALANADFGLKLLESKAQ